MINAIEYTQKYMTRRILVIFLILISETFSQTTSCQLKNIDENHGGYIPWDIDLYLSIPEKEKVNFDPSKEYKIGMISGEAGIIKSAIRIDSLGNVKGIKRTQKSGEEKVSYQTVAATIDKDELACIIQTSKILNLKKLYSGIAFDASYYIFVLSQNGTSKTIGAYGHIPKEYMTFFRTVNELLNRYANVKKSERDSLFSMNEKTIKEYEKNNIYPIPQFWQDNTYKK